MLGSLAPIHSTLVHISKLGFGRWVFEEAFGLKLDFDFTYTNSFICFVNGMLYTYYTTFNNGSLGSRIDEERSEMR